MTLISDVISKEEQEALTPAKVVERLCEGNRCFLAGEKSGRDSLS